jgi:catechol 2,3-dioxygenase-like lactoylglutathione lyase family enzyme
MSTRDETVRRPAPNGFVRACPQWLIVPSEPIIGACHATESPRPSRPRRRGHRCLLHDHFGFRLVDTRGNNGFALLLGTGGFALVLTRRRAEGVQDYPDNFHIGFLVESDAAVHAARARIQAAGVPDLPSVSFQRGATLFYVHAPGGVLVEVSHRSPP